MASTPLVALRIPADVTARLDTLAAARGLTRSDAIREAIAAALEAAESQEPAA